IISTHLISDIEPILDEVIFLKQGRLFLSGNADDLRQEYQQSIDSLFRETYKV
ncbi:TPA: ABC transporter ATP-binding protein, partial [Streptococcus pyogenes]